MSVGARSRPCAPLLGAREATLLSPLHARAVDAAKAVSLLGDRLSLELTRRLLGEAPPSARTAACAHAWVVRAHILDEVVRDFLRSWPAGTVVELGAGLGTRFERLAPARATWLDVDLPDVVALRRSMLPRHPRRSHVADPIEGEGWVALAAACPGPHCFLLEATTGYLDEPALHTLADRLARFAGATIAFDPPPAATADVAPTSTRCMQRASIALASAMPVAPASAWPRAAHERGASPPWRQVQVFTVDDHRRAADVDVRARPALR